jgi:purine-binding chemotaxis protein CheW
LVPALATLGLDLDLVLFALDGQRYALALERVRRVVRAVAITPLPGAPPIVLGVLDLGGEVIPAVSIRDRFGHPRREVGLSDHLVIATAGKRTVALLVDEVTGVLR